MSRSGYSDDCDDNWSLIRWRGAVRSAMCGRRGQAFLRDMLASLDALPARRLIRSEFRRENGEVCALGAVAARRGVDVSGIDPDDDRARDYIAPLLGIAPALAAEIMYENDLDWSWMDTETPEQRFDRVRRWVEGNIR